MFGITYDKWSSKENKNYKESIKKLHNIKKKITKILETCEKRRLGEFNFAHNKEKQKKTSSNLFDVNG